MEKAVFQTSHNLVRSGGYSIKHRKRSSLHFCTPISVTFIVDDCTVSHARVFVTRRKWRATWTGALARVSCSASSDRLAFCFRNSSLPYLKNLAWSHVLNSFWSLGTAMRCPVTTQDAVEFSGAVMFRYRRAIPARFTVRQVTPCPRIPFPTPWKMDGMNESVGAFLTSTKRSPMSGVTRCKIAHPCCSDFCSSA